MPYSRDPRCITPIMTSANTPVPTVVTASSNYDATWAEWHAFDGADGGAGYCWSSNASPPQWIRIDLGIDQDTEAAGYEMTERADGADGAATWWTFEGSINDVDWHVLDTQVNQTTVSAGEVRRFLFSRTSQKYRYFRLTITAVKGAWAPAVAELQILGPNHGPLLCMRGRSRALAFQMER